MGEHDERVLAGLVESGVEQERAAAIVEGLDCDDPTLLVFRTPVPTGASTARVEPGDVVRILIPDAEPWTMALSHVEDAGDGRIALVGLAAVDAPARWEMTFTAPAWYEGAETPARLSRGSIGRQLEWAGKDRKRRRG